MNRRNDFASVVRNPAFVFSFIALILICVLFFFLGKWQWDRTQNILEAERAAASQPVVAELVLAGELRSEDFGRTLTAKGNFSRDNQVRVVNRLSSGSDEAAIGEWIVSQFTTESGTNVAVVRGWVSTGSEFVTPESTVEVSGVIQPNEAFYAGADSNSMEVVVIDSDALEQLWDVSLSDGFIVLQDQSPSIAGEPVPVPPTISTGDVPFPLQNFFYAIQWWVFAAFAVLLYVRWIYMAANKPSNH